MSSAFADLQSRNQQLQNRIIELEAEQASFSLYQRQLSQQLDTLKKNRQEMSTKYKQLQKRIDDERQSFLEAIRLREEQNSRLVQQISILNNQKQYYQSSLAKVQETYHKMEEQLESKTTLIAQLLKK